MPYRFEFQEHRHYGSLPTGISLEAVLRSGGLVTTCLAKVDTGAEVCLFERGAAEALEIDIESGTARRLSTLTGGLLAYGHEIILETLGFQFQTFVYFAEPYEVRRNILADTAGCN